MHKHLVNYVFRERVKQLGHHHLSCVFRQVGFADDYLQELLVNVKLLHQSSIDETSLPHLEHRVRVSWRSPHNLDDLRLGDVSFVQKVSLAIDALLHWVIFNLIHVLVCVISLLLILVITRKAISVIGRVLLSFIDV